MEIVLNEFEWAKNMIEQRSLGKKPFETLVRVAKYYIGQQHSKKEVRKLLSSFLIQCDPSVSIPRWSDTLDKALDVASKNSAVVIDGIVVTKKEMAKIDLLRGRQMRRLAFTLLCLSKYWDIVNNTNTSWVNSKDSDIMRMANINTSVKRQSMMYHELNAVGLIRFSRKVDNTNVQVLFSEPGEEALRISDFRNLGYQYLGYHGEPYIQCQHCGMTIKIRDPMRGGRQKYCRQCAIEMSMQQKINSIMKKRNK